MRLAELFNVNHFILSQASPIMAPLVSKALQDGSESLWSRLGFLVMNEVRHRVLQLGHLGLLPRFVQAIFDNQRFQGNVTIAPHVETRVCYCLLFRCDVLKLRTKFKPYQYYRTFTLFFQIQHIRRCNIGSLKENNRLGHFCFTSKIDAQSNWLLIDVSITLFLLINFLKF